LQYVFQFFFGGDVKGITTTVPKGFKIGPITTDATTLVLAGDRACVIIAFTFFLYRTRLGRRDSCGLGQCRPGFRLGHQRRAGGAHRMDYLHCALAALAGVLIGIYLNGIAWNTGAGAAAAHVLGGDPGRSGHSQRCSGRFAGHRHRRGYELADDSERYALRQRLAILIIVLLPAGCFRQATESGLR
jgi:branched-chain amino acid transport system permease protein